jgi:hypothetical protein
VDKNTTSKKGETFPLLISICVSIAFTLGIITFTDREKSTVHEATYHWS